MRDVSVRAGRAFSLGMTKRNRLLHIERHDFVGEFSETRIATQRIEQRFHFDQANFRSLFVLVASFETVDCFALITKAKVNQSKAEAPANAPCSRSLICLNSWHAFSRSPSNA